MNAIAIWSVCLAGLLPGVEAPGQPGPVVKDFALSDTTGRKHTAAGWRDHKAIVLIFLGTECPVSNGYAPEYRRLVEMFHGKGVQFLGIHPDPDVTAAAAAKHAAAYKLPFTVLLDPMQVVARQAGVKVVPEAVMLTATGEVRYRGRVDDRYTLDGKRRDEPKRRDLEEALKAVLGGKAPSLTETRGFGCPLPEPLRPRKDNR